MTISFCFFCINPFYKSLYIALVRRCRLAGALTGSVELDALLSAESASRASRTSRRRSVLFTAHLRFSTDSVHRRDRLPEPQGFTLLYSGRLPEPQGFTLLYSGRRDRLPEPQGFTLLYSTVAADSVLWRRHLRLWGVILICRTLFDVLVIFNIFVG